MIWRRPSGVSGGSPTAAGPTPAAPSPAPWTRRYHGLLIAPLDPPLGRYLVVVKADAMLIDGDAHWPLFSNRWGGDVVDPRGHAHIESFHLEGRMPVWRFAVGGMRLEMRQWLEPGADTAYVAYRLDPGNGEIEKPLALQIRLLCNACDHHGASAPGAFDPDVRVANPAPGGAQRLTVTHGGSDGRGGYTLGVQTRSGTLTPERTWYENFDLPIERERGLPAQDRHLCIATAHITLHPGEWTGLAISLHADASPYLEEALRRFLARESTLLTEACVRLPELCDAPPWIGQLLLAADSFVFARPLADVPDGESVIAGYPWFGDWGRDTMIALPGLTLATGRYDSARRILQTFARFVDQGMLPNVFPGSGVTPEYNSADAALWYLEAWRAYLSASDDVAVLRAVFPVLADIIRWHARGTRHGVAMDADDGLLRAGEPGVQVTWMDAKIGDWVVTPRIGKPVEINALWYNALKIMVEFCRKLKFDTDEYEQMAQRTEQGFQRFICPQSAALFDVLDGPGGHDSQIRPNQILAVSLTYSALAAPAQARVVRACAQGLLTSYGLRSLSPRAAEYRGRYIGGVWERDSAYHQGPVWVWLLGHYALAEYRVTGDAAAAQARLEPIGDHLLDAGLGTVSEILDGEPPHTPRGAPAQAWSVACVLEAWSRLERAKRHRPRKTAVKAETRTNAAAT